MSEENILHIMIFAAAADEDIKDVEVMKIMSVTNTHPQFRNHNQKSIIEQTRTCLDMLDKCGSVEACAQEVATRMNEGEKIMAYSLAWEICAADYVIHKSEKIFLDHLKTTCNVSEQIAEAVRVSICARCPNLPGV